MPDSPSPCPSPGVINPSNKTTAKHSQKNKVKLSKMASKPNVAARQDMPPPGGYPKVSSEKKEWYFPDLF